MASGICAPSHSVHAPKPSCRSETVGARHEKLEKHGWHVLHSIPVGKGESDLDHLLIGLGGVFTVNTKNQPGKQVWVGQHLIKVKGHSTRYLPIARYARLSGRGSFCCRQ